MNWGSKLIIGMLSFMIFIIVLCVLMFRSQTDGLVDTDYYEKGLKYDDTYRQKEQVLEDDAAPQVRILKDSLVISFKTDAQGSIRLMRIADLHMDKKSAFKTKVSKSLALPTNGLSRGSWKLIIKWSGPDTKTYLYEDKIILP